MQSSRLQADMQERTVSRDDLLHARTPLEVAKDVPTLALDAPIPTEPHYIRTKEKSGWVGLHVYVGPAPPSAPASATTDVQQPVTADSSPSGSPAVEVTTSAQPVPRRSTRINKGGVAGELCKLARVTGPEFPHPFSPAACQRLAGAQRYKRQCLPGFCRGFQARSKDQEILQEGGGAGPST